MRLILNKTLFFSLFFSLIFSSSYAQEERTQILPYKYDEVWRGVLIALAKYPLKKNNQEIGLIETDLIKSDQLWSVPFKKTDLHLRYKLIFRLFNGNSGTKNATKITVTKEAFLKNDFLGDNKKVESDGFEEMALIYRANREIKINKLSDQKFNAKSKSKSRKRK